MKQSVSLRSNYDAKHDVKTNYKTPKCFQAQTIFLHDNSIQNWIQNTMPKGCIYSLFQASCDVATIDGLYSNKRDE